MPRNSRIATLAGLTICLLLTARLADAQTNSTAERPALKAAITNSKTVVLSWPVRAGNWVIAEQRPAFKTIWRRMEPELYRTNGDMISITLPLPTETALYRLQPVLSSRPPDMPPLPSPTTNRSRPASFPAPPGSADPKRQNATTAP